MSDDIHDIFKPKEKEKDSGALCEVCGKSNMMIVMQTHTRNKQSNLVTQHLICPICNERYPRLYDIEAKKVVMDPHGSGI